MALSTAVLIADTIKSAYLSKSLVDMSPGKSSELSNVWNERKKWPVLNCVFHLY